MNPVRGARAQRSVVASSAAQQVRVDVVDVGGGQLGDGDVAEVGHEVAAHQAAGACQVVCVSGSRLWRLEVRVDAVGVDEGELLEGLLPAGGDLAFHEAAGCFALGGG